MSLLAVAGPAGAATCAATPRFAGSFLQPGLGDTWTSAAAPAAGDADQARTYRLLGLNTTARYVRITVEPAGSAWSFTDEVEVRTT
ncbi:hypothetical protein [Nonomuraea sp. NPDC003201]